MQVASPNGAPLTGPLIDIECHLVYRNRALGVVGNDKSDVATHRHHGIGAIRQTLARTVGMGMDVGNDFLSPVFTHAEEAREGGAWHVHGKARERLWVKFFVRHEGLDDTHAVTRDFAQQERAALAAAGADSLQMVCQVMPQRRRDAELWRR